jgi:hypothetical protein
MKKILLSALILLAGFGSSAQAANLYASNLGNGLTLVGGTTAITSGSVRFGVFPAGYDFSANAENFTALDTAFIEVASYNGAINTSSTNGFFQLALSYVTSGSFEGRAYDSTPGSTADTSSTDVAGEKVYIWIQNNVTPSAATEQAIFSTNQRWVDADEVIQDTFTSPDSGTTGLAAHLGQLAVGADIGAGAGSHINGGATEIVSNVVATRAPATGTVLVGASVTFSYTADGTTPFTQKWFKTGSATELGSGATLNLPSAQLTDDGTYFVVVTNGAGDSTSNTVALDVITALPAFDDHPDAIAGKVGSNISLSVVAKGQAPLTYRWLKGTTPVPGATRADLTLHGVSLADAGLYRCEVSNVIAGKANKVLSNQALVTIVQDNTPAARVVVRESTSGSATLTLAYAETGATLNKATLQWKKDGQVIDGATTKTLKISPLAASAAPVLYTCEVQAVGVASPIIGASTEVIVINLGPLITSPLALNMPDGQVGEPYFFQVPVDGTLTRTPATFAAAGLPKGLVINKLTGEITGRPQAITPVGKPAKITITVANGVMPNAVATDSIAITGITPDLAGLWVGPIERDILSDNLGGRLEMTVAATGVVSGKIFLGTLVHSFAGGLESGIDDSATGSFTIKRLISQAPLTVTFTLAGNELSLGDITDGDNRLSFEGWRNKWLANPPAANATDYIARYNMMLELNDGELLGDLDVPQGKSFASFSVAKDGKLTFVGKLADGEAITGGTFVGPTGQVFMFQTLYKTLLKGSLLGKLNIDADTNFIDGDADWSRPANYFKNTLYADGFDAISLGIDGGAYTRPDDTKVVLNIDSGTNNALVEITDGNLEDPEDVGDDLIETASITTGSKITVGNDNELTIKMTAVPATGVLGGTLVPGAKSEKLEGLIVPIQGVLTGVGFYLVNDTTLLKRLSGAFTLKDN